MERKVLNNICLDNAELSLMKKIRKEREKVGGRVSLLIPLSMIAGNENISFKDNKPSNTFYLKIFKSKKLNTKEYN